MQYLMYIYIIKLIRVQLICFISNDNTNNKPSIIGGGFIGEWGIRPTIIL